MSRIIILTFLVGSAIVPNELSAQEKPYITTRRPITLLSANDGELDVVWRKTDEGLVDYDIKTRDSFTVIRLSPNEPPETKTYYGMVPCTIIGTPTMAMSKDGRYGLITNHGQRFLSGIEMRFPGGTPLTNEDIRGADLLTQHLAPPYSNMLSMIDLGCDNCRVVDRVLLDDAPGHVLAHPDGEHFVVGGSTCFYVFKIESGKLVEVGRSRPHGRGLTCFWIHPDGDRILATQGDPATTDPGEIHWYRIAIKRRRCRITHISQVKAAPGVDAGLHRFTAITRISPDGSKALVCQRAVGDAGELCGVLVVDLTARPPVISGVVEQVGDGVESFAFHPNGKMAVVTSLARHSNSISVLDMTQTPPRLLYHLNTGGIAQGIEFDPDGEKLFVGSAVTNRIEVFDVVGDFELRKNPKFLKTGHGHCSLTLGATP